MSIVYGTSIEKVLEELVLAPVKHPELLPTVLPLIIGAITLEIYFGKHVEENLGWNTSVGNAVLWIATGINLLITSELTATERKITYFIIGLGGFVGYMDFYHKWSDTVAFIVSSAGIVYSLAYVTVVIVKTSLEINQTVIKAGVIFIVGVNILFKIMQQFEAPTKDGIGTDF